MLARPITEKLREEIAGAAVSDQDQILILLDMHPGKSLAGMAEALSWFFESGDADKSRASRAANSLRKDGMLNLERRGRWVLTDKGTKEAKRLEP